MQLPVSLVRSKSRRLATKIVPADADLTRQLDALRSWALTMGVQAHVVPSWTRLEDGDYEVRCNVDDETEVHPDDGIQIKHAPSTYVAEVECPDSKIAPESVSGALETWVQDAGYGQLEPCEIVVNRQGEGYTVTVPVKKRTAPPFIEV